MRKTFAFASLLSLLVVTSLSAQQVFTVKDPAWSFSGQDVTVAAVDGRDAIKIGRGQALLEQVAFQNGTIEFDVYLPEERAFAYLYFRGKNDQEFEEIYLRTHKSMAPDALQYAPVFQRRAAWQLYHGDKGTAAANFAAKQWVPVKVVLEDSRLQVWIGSTDEPTMTINQMGRAPQAGWLGFRGFVPNNSSAPFSAYFSDITLTPKVVDTSLPETPSSTLPSGQITQWRVSPAFASQPGPIESVPADVLAAEWIKPTMQPDGSFELLRSIQVPQGVRHWSAVAEVEIQSDKAQTCAISLGFSDQITLSLNGQPILYQDARYSFDKPRRQGLMHAEQLLTYLPLKSGNNLLRAVISDNFGGWGLMGRLENCLGIKVR